jgi:hypothetical protein
MWLYQHVAGVAEGMATGSQEVVRVGLVTLLTELAQQSFHNASR